MKLLGNYYLTLRDDLITTSDPNKNYLYYIYKVTIGDPSTEDNQDDTIEYYYYYPNILLMEDGTCSYDLDSIVVPEGSMSFGIVSGEAFSVSHYFYTGYQDLETLYKKHVTENDAFECESTVK